MDRKERSKLWRDAYAAGRRDALEDLSELIDALTRKARRKAPHDD